MYLKSSNELNLNVISKVVNEVGTIIIWWKSDGTGTYYGEDFCNLQISEENIFDVFEHVKVGEYINFEDYYAFSQMIEQAGRESMAAESQVRFRRNDGTYRWYQVRLTIVDPNKNEGLRGICALTDCQDMVGRNLHQNDINNQGKALLSMMPCGVVILEEDEIPNWSIVFVSDGVEELYGYTRAERNKMLGKKIKDLFHDDDWNEKLEQMLECVRKDEDFAGTMRIRNRKGKYVWTSLRAKRIGDSYGKITLCVTLTEFEKEKEKERLLLEKNNKLRNAMQDADVTIWKENLVTHSVEVESVIGISWKKKGITTNLPNSLIDANVVHAKSKIDFLLMYNRLSFGEKRIEADIWFIDKNGEYWCERISYEIFFDRYGDPEFATGMARDITKEKLFESQLQREMLYRDSVQRKVLASAVLNLTQNKVVSLDTQNEFIMENLNIRTADEFLADVKATTRIVSGLEPGEDCFSRTWFLCLYENGIFTKNYCRESYISDTNLVWNEVTVSMTEDYVTGDIYAIYCVEDISDKKMVDAISEMVPQLAYDFLETIDLESNTSTHYFIADKHDCFAEVEEDYNCKVREYIIKNCKGIDQARCLREFCTETIKARLQEEDSYVVKYSIWGDDGYEKRKKVIISRLNGERERALSAVVDITEDYIEEHRHRSEITDALRAAKEANQTKSRFLASMSHEIRTPLNAILGMTQLVLDSKDEPELTRKYLEKMLDSEEYLLTLLTDILEVAKMELGTMLLDCKPIDVQRLLDDIRIISQEAADEKGLTYKQTEDIPKDACCLGDMVRIQQVIINIISNAVKFTQVGGRVKVMIKADQEGDILKFCFKVCDTGIGIKKESLPFLFHPFWQENSNRNTRDGGIGIGLEVSAKLLDIMGGRIEVESEPGEGSTFTIYFDLPVDKVDTFSEEDKYKHTEEQWRTCLGGKKVLIVDDNLINLELMVTMCEMYGMETTAAKDGKEACEILGDEENKKFDLVLMDIRMPVMDGYQATEKIRQSESEYLKKIPILAASANAYPEDIEESYAHGMNGHISKPIMKEALMNRMYQLLDK